MGAGSSVGFSGAFGRSSKARFASSPTVVDDHHVAGQDDEV
jgi:hypothetical protein